MLETDSLYSPMVAINDPQTLQRLAYQLQVETRSWFPDTPMQIQCVVKQGDLMVLGQHPPDSNPDPYTVFSALEQAIQTLLPTFSNERVLGTEATQAQAKLYLRKLGERQPYAAHSFQLPPLTQAPLPAAERAETGEASLDAGRSLDGSDRVDDSDYSDTTHDSNCGHTADDSSLTTDSIYDSTDVERSALTQLDPELEPTIAPASRFGRSSLLPWLVAGVGVSVVGFTGGLWFMSRPCMVGVCEPLQTAQTLNQKSLQTLQTAKTQQDLQQAQQQLTEATQQLQSVPTWSRHHDAAQALQQTTQTQAQALDQVLGAEDKANTAIQKSQALPQSAADLKATQALWREAIAQLQAIPSASPLYNFAQQRLTAYEANMAAIGKLTIAEQQAQKKLAAAKETAKIAEARQGIAQTPESWQLAQTTWQVVINTLREISTSSTSYAEAQRLLTEYQPKLMAARDRATQEQIAQKAFNQAIALAQKAEAAQRRNQWSQAVANWRDALTNIKQVPTNTAYADPAQPLVASYSTALKQAEAQLQIAAAMQRTRDDLNRVCTGSPRMCTYAIASGIIRVQFTPAYERKLRTAFIIGQSGDRNTLGGAVNHIDTLQTALQTISTNAGLPLEVYSADGSELIGSFNPKG